MKALGCDVSQDPAVSIPREDLATSQSYPQRHRCHRACSWVPSACFCCPSPPGSLLPRNRSIAGHPGSQSLEEKNSLDSHLQALLWPGSVDTWLTGYLLTVHRQLSIGCCPLTQPLQTPLCLGLPLSSLRPQMSPPSPHPSRDGPNPASLQHVIYKWVHFDLPTSPWQQLFYFLFL